MLARFERGIVFPASTGAIHSSSVERWKRCVRRCNDSRNGKQTTCCKRNAKDDNDFEIFFEASGSSKEDVLGGSTVDKKADYCSEVVRCKEVESVGDSEVDGVHFKVGTVGPHKRDKEETQENRA